MALAKLCHPEISVYKIAAPYVIASATMSRIAL
jgi:hypothetical protein